MRRQRGIMEVDRYKDTKFGVDVAICLNKENGNFLAEYEGETVVAPTLEKLRSALFLEVKNRVGLPWEPIIQVSVNGGKFTITDVIEDSMHNDELYQRKHERIDGDLKIHAKRYWLAKRADGVWMECTIWDSRDWQSEGLKPDNAFLATADRRINAHKFYAARHERAFALPFTVKSNRSSVDDEGQVHYLPYDESLWQALNAVGDKMGQMLEQLQGLVGTPKGRKQLMASAQRMLPSGKEAK